LAVLADWRRYPYAKGKVHIHNHATRREAPNSRKKPNKAPGKRRKGIILMRNSARSLLNSAKCGTLIHSKPVARLFIRLFVVWIHSHASSWSQCNTRGILYERASKLFGAYKNPLKMARVARHKKLRGKSRRNEQAYSPDLSFGKKRFIHRLNLSRNAGLGFFK